MWKLISIIATTVLATSSLSGVTAWKEANKQPTTATKNYQQTNEDAEDIANKLFNKTVTLSPFFWLNKAIADDPSAFNAAIVKEGLLTQSELQYVSWAYLSIDEAKIYSNFGFTVKKDGATATGYMTVDVSVHATPTKKVNPPNPETAQTIANKLIENTITIDLANWTGKRIDENMALFRQTLVKEDILTQDEAQYVTNGNLQSLGVISKATIDPGIVLDVTKDGQTVGAGNITLKINAETAQQIANKLQYQQVDLSLVDFNNHYINEKGTIQNIIRVGMVYKNFLTPTEAKAVSCISHYYVNSPGPESLVFEVNTGDGTPIFISAVLYFIDDNPSFKNADYYNYLLAGRTITLNPWFLNGAASTWWTDPTKIQYFQETLVEEGYATAAESKYFKPNVNTSVPTVGGQIVTGSVIDTYSGNQVVSGINFVCEPTNWVQGWNISEQNINLTFTFSAINWNNFLNLYKSHFTLGDPYGFGAYLAQYANNGQFTTGTGLLPQILSEHNYTQSHNLSGQFYTFASKTKESKEQIITDIMSNTNSSLGTGLGIRLTEYYLSTASKWNPGGQVTLNLAYGYNDKTNTYSLKNISGNAV